MTILFSLIGLDIYLGDLTQHVGIVFLLIMVLVSMAAGHELKTMWNHRDDCPMTPVVLLGMSVIISFSCAPMLWVEYPANCAVGPIGWTLFGLAFSVGLTFVSEMVVYQQHSHGLIASRIGRTLFVFVYIGLMMSFLSCLRFFGDNRTGMLAFVSVCAIVKFSDAAAYFTGKTIGRNKLTPVLSPGKTVEGTIGGIIGGVLAAWFVFFVVAPIVFQVQTEFRWWAVGLMGLALSLAGIIGDLAESLLKREADAKDSSGWLPGLGGILDIIDSVLAATPVSFAFWASGCLIVADSA